LVDLPEGVFGDEFDPSFVSVVIECMIVCEVGGVSVVLNKIEVTSHDKVHVARNVAQKLELLGSTVVVVLTRGQVHVEQSEGEGGVAAPRAPLQAQALGLALEGGAEWLYVGVIVVACVW
jgi:hypothetical protein